MNYKQLLMLPVILAIYQTLFTTILFQVKHSFNKEYIIKIEIPAFFRYLNIIYFILMFSFILFIPIIWESTNLYIFIYYFTLATVSIIDILFVIKSSAEVIKSIGVFKLFIYITYKSKFINFLFSPLSSIYFFILIILLLCIDYLYR